MPLECASCGKFHQWESALLFNAAKNFIVECFVFKTISGLQWRLNELSAAKPVRLALPRVVNSEKIGASAACSLQNIKKSSHIANTTRRSGCTASPGNSAKLACVVESKEFFESINYQQSLKMIPATGLDLRQRSFHIIKVYHFPNGFVIMENSPKKACPRYVRGEFSGLHHDIRNCIAKKISEF
jgi:hypothetical protein